MSDDPDGQGPRGVGVPKEVAGSLDPAAAEMERVDGFRTALGSSGRTLLVGSVCGGREGKRSIADDGCI